MDYQVNFVCIKYLLFDFVFQLAVVSEAKEVLLTDGNEQSCKSKCWKLKYNFALSLRIP